MSKKLTLCEFIEKAKHVHGDMYDYSLVEYVDSKTKVKIICPIHGIFNQSPSNHLLNHGCSICSGNLRSNDNDFKIKSELIHGNKYDYSLVKYKNNSTKVKIICPTHGIFEQTPHDHLGGHGCTECAIINVSDINRLKICEFSKKSEIVHNKKYDYSLVEYKNNSTNVKIICKKHNIIFEQTPKHHLNGQGCPICGLNISKNHLRSNDNDFKIKSESIHRNKYDYSLVEYINTDTKVKIICKKHNIIFEQTPKHHLMGCGCSKCNESKGEKKISIILEDNKINYISQHKFNDCKHKNRLPFDFYLEKYNTCIEYDGRQHTVSVERFGGEKALNLIKLRDDIKNKYCEQNGINLIRISYTDNIDEKMSEFFNMYKNHKKCGIFLGINN